MLKPQEGAQRIRFFAICLIRRCEKWENVTTLTVNLRVAAVFIAVLVSESSQRWKSILLYLWTSVLVVFSLSFMHLKIVSVLRDTLYGSSHLFYFTFCFLIIPPVCFPALFHPLLFAPLLCFASFHSFSFLRLHQPTSVCPFPPLCNSLLRSSLFIFLIPFHFKSLSAALYSLSVSLQWLTLFPSNNLSARLGNTLFVCGCVCVRVKQQQSVILRKLL